MLSMLEASDTASRLNESSSEAADAKVDADKAWSDIRDLLWRALGPFPEARAAVTRELEAVGDRE